MNDKPNNPKYVQEAGNNEVFSSFEDQQMEAVIKRTEKVVSAIHLVTNLVSDSDSIKWAIRGNAVSLIRRLFPAAGESVFGRQEAFRQTAKTINENSSLIEVAKLSKLISEMNAEIIKKELESLKVFIEDINKSETSPEFILSGLFDDDGGKRELPGGANLLPQKNIKDTNHKGHFYKGHALPGRSPKKTFNTKTIKDKKNTLAEKDARKTAIINLFKKNKELMIKDISSAIYGCSEKTIQRELNALLKDKVIKKVGEKRWSKYYLNRG